jgi:predicted nucleic acid-binding protein
VTQPLVDVNVVLDALLGRAPHGVAAAGLWAAAEKKHVRALFPAHGVTTLFYLLRQAKGAPTARRAVESVLSVFSVAPVDGGVLLRALSLGWTDFEDAVCAAAAEAVGCDLIVTRNPGDFRGSSVPVVDPATALSLLKSGEEPESVSERARWYGPRPARRRRR